MKRRHLLATAATVTSAAVCRPILSQTRQGVSVTDLPELSGSLTLYLGRGEGGLYENVIAAIEERNPKLTLGIRRGPTAALANSIVAEHAAGVRRADVFWAVDAGAIGMVSEAINPRRLPRDLTRQLKDDFRYDTWVPVSGRIRTLPYNPLRVSADSLPTAVAALPTSDTTPGWAPAYASFQSFVTAMRLLAGEDATGSWLQSMDRTAKRFAGELGVVMAVERGEIDVGLANHYYTLRLLSGKPEASVALAFTQGDAGCLVNASGAMNISGGELAENFIRYLLTQEVQRYLSREAYEIPMIPSAPYPPGMAFMSTLVPPKVDLTQLSDVRPTLELMRRTGVL